MCGIAGIIGLKDTVAAESKIRSMNESLKHRGPDADGVFVEQGAALGHLRLSIIDLSDSANQPFFDQSKRFCIVFNGEIYNYREVRAIVKDYPYKTNSDTEVILAAYIKYGAECLSMLNGMFAFAIWDTKRRELFVARDRLGVKPFYYSLTADGVFVFASEIRALLNSQLIPRKLNKQGIFDYLMHQSVYSPETIVENIRQLPAGDFGVFADGNLTTRSYWKIENSVSDILAASDADIRKNIKNLLLNSVEQRMISDVRLGAFLSGGIDSSAIVALMSEVSDRPVETFSVTFGEKEYDESKYSNIVAEKFKTAHTNVFLTAADFLDALPEALRAVDSPSGDGLNTYVVSRATRRSGIKVALSGLGGDELFAGYHNFVQWFKTRRGFLPHIPYFLRKTFAAPLRSSSNSKYQRMANVISAENINLTSIYPMFRQVMSQQSVDELYRNGSHQVSIEKILKGIEAEIENFPLLSQFTIAELLGYTQNVLLKDTDQFSMASALEVREPFFDYKLVEYVLRIPDRLKYPKYPKSLLVEALAPLLPDEIVHRPKMGFVLPYDKWMRHELKEFCGSRLENLAARKILDPDRLLQKWSDFQNRRNGVLWSHLWHLVVLTEWLENNKFES